MMTYGDFKKQAAPHGASDWVAWALRLLIAVMLGVVLTQFQAIKREMRDLKNSQHRLEIGIASNYATNDELDQVRRNLGMRLDRHEDRLHGRRGGR